jgi:hypothetical protein
MLIFFTLQGFMFKVKVKINDGRSVLQALPEPVRLVTFLRHRTNGKAVLLECLLEFCRRISVKLAEIGEALDILNREYRRHMEDQMRRNMALPASTFSSAKQALSRVVGGSGTSSSTTATSRPLAKVLVDQADLYASLFSPLLEDPEVTRKRVICIIMEYYRGLEQYEVNFYGLLNLHCQFRIRAD